MTQCALSKHITKPNKMYCGNIGLKINSKVANAPLCFRIRCCSFLPETPQANP
jgi:hypothetical protein